MDIDYTLHNFIGNLVSSRANKGLVYAIIIQWTLIL